MKLRERWRTLPWDARFGYVAAGCFALWFALCVATGPHLFLMLSGCLTYLLLAGVMLVSAFQFAVWSPRRRRVLPLALVSGCLTLAVVAPGATVDLHLIARVYLAGGPGAVNDWAQGLIRERRGEADARPVKPDEVPPGIWAYLPGAVSEDRTPWSDQPRVRVELGGGFYHYGVVVYPAGTGPPASWWQRVLGWPPEVIVYHEE